MGGSAGWRTAATMPCKSEIREGHVIGNYASQKWSDVLKDVQSTDNVGALRAARELTKHVRNGAVEVGAEVTNHAVNRERSVGQGPGAWSLHHVSTDPICPSAQWTICLCSSDSLQRVLGLIRDATDHLRIQSNSGSALRGLSRVRPWSLGRNDGSSATPAISHATPRRTITYYTSLPSITA
ncbi:hypothetical protein J6590_003157 [Homalodisca vitripennis]|nr:hypothetical protein J6590_003157 [Homalodisca vitripennis]